MGLWHILHFRFMEGFGLETNIRYSFTTVRYVYIRLITDRAFQLFYFAENFASDSTNVFPIGAKGVSLQIGYLLSEERSGQCKRI